MGWRLIDFAELQFTGADLKRLPRVHAGFLVASSLAVSEISVLLRLTLLAANAYKHVGREDAVRRLSVVDLLVSERLLSAKLFEYLKLVDDYLKKADRKEKEAGRRLVGEAVTSVLLLREAGGFHMAEWLRNNLTNHILVSEIERFLDDIPDARVFPSFLNEKEGNSRYAIGEEVAMAGKLNQQGEPLAILEEWRDWMHDACTKVFELHSEFMIHVIEEFFPEKRLRRKRVVVPDELIGELDKSCTPILWNFDAVGR
jgi:hypothetical protein